MKVYRGQLILMHRILSLSMSLDVSENLIVWKATLLIVYWSLGNTSAFSSDEKIISSSSVRTRKELLQKLWKIFLAVGQKDFLQFSLVGTSLKNMEISYFKLLGNFWSQIVEIIPMYEDFGKTGLISSL